jgi:hypothetical protein
VVQPQHFLLPGCATAAQEVHHLEGHQVEVGRPLVGLYRAALPELQRNRQQPVDQSVEVRDDVGVQVVHQVRRVPRSNALQPFQLWPAGVGEFPEEEFSLQAVVVVGEFSHFLADAAVLLGHELVEALLDLIGHFRHVLAVLQLEGLDVVREVVGSGELALEFLAPLGEQAQDLRVVDADVAGTDFLLGKRPCAFRYLSSDLIACILLHLASVLLTLFQLHLLQLLLQLQRFPRLRPLPYPHWLTPLLLRLLHPLQLHHVFEQPTHLILELLVDRPTGDAQVKFAEEVVEHAHDEVTVVGGLAEAEDDWRGEDVVVGELVGVIDLADGAVDAAVDVLRHRHRVLAQHVLQHSLRLQVYRGEVLPRQRVSLGQTSQVAQYLLRTVGLGVVEGELVGGIVVESSRPDRPAQRSHEALQRL